MEELGLETQGDKHNKEKEAQRQKLTEIESKINKKEELNQEELQFVYRFPGIEGYGSYSNKQDERFTLLQGGLEASLGKNLATIFGVEEEEVCMVKENFIEGTTKVYVGRLSKEILNSKSVEHIYASFLEREIKRENFDIRGINGSEVIGEFSKTGGDGDKSELVFKGNAKDIIESGDFDNKKETGDIKFIRLRLSDLDIVKLGEDKSVSFGDIIGVAERMGLSYLPVNFAPEYAIKFKDQISMGQFSIFMKSETGSVFQITYNGQGETSLDTSSTIDKNWHLDHDSFIFRLEDTK